MKLSCPTNSPGAYADTRARVQRPVERRAVVLPHGCGDEPNAVRKRSRNALIGQTGACGLGLQAVLPAPAGDLVACTFGSWAMTEIGTSWLAPWPLTSVAG